jgi:predicted DNA-binding transcriptional regulator YafY
MSTQGTIKRYTLLFEKINNGTYPPFKELKDFLEDHGFTISPRTLQRDIEQIRNEFCIEILYNRSRNGYYIDKENSHNIESFIKFLEIAGTGEIISDTLRDGKEVLSYMSFDSEGDLRGIENLKELVHAVKNHRKVKFVHENYFKNTKKQVMLCPYHLKQYQNRWYAFGTLDGTNTTRTFGIDRITELKILTDKFKPDAKINPIKLFEEVIGLTYSFSKIEEVDIWLSAQQVKYAESLPIHHTQRFIETNKEGAILRMNVRLNFELTQKILTLGDNAKVLKPQALVDEVKDLLSDMLGMYKK